MKGRPFAFHPESSMLQSDANMPGSFVAQSLGQRRGWAAVPGAVLAKVARTKVTAGPTALVTDASRFAANRTSNTNSLGDSCLLCGCCQTYYFTAAYTTLTTTAAPLHSVLTTLCQLILLVTDPVRSHVYVFRGIGIVKQAWT